MAVAQDCIRWSPTSIGGRTPSSRPRDFQNVRLPHTAEIILDRGRQPAYTFDYSHAAKADLQEWCKPPTFYRDTYGIFRTTHPSNKDHTSGLTQFGRALDFNRRGSP